MRVLAGDEDVARWSTYVGRGAIRFYLPLDVQLPNDFFTQAVIVAKDVDARDRLQAKLDKLLAEEFPEAVSRTSPLELGPPVGWPVQYRVSGPEMDQVREIALGLAGTVATNPDTRSINFDWNEPARQVRVRVDQDEARRLGLSSAALAGVLNAAVTGSTVTQVRDDIYLIDVVARAIGEERISLPTLRTLQVPLPNGRTVALNQFASFEYAQEYPMVWRRDRVPTLTVRADVAPGVLPESVVTELAPAIAEAECRPAAGLPDRARRHRRGERLVARLGVRGRAGDAADHAHGPDVPPAELPAPFHGARHPAARPDRRGRRAPCSSADHSASSPYSASLP